MIFGLVICLLCVNLLEASTTYRAATVHVNKEISTDYVPFVYEAGRKYVDILVLPPPKSADEDNYDKTVSALSKAADDANLYVVAHLYEKTRCQNSQEVIRSNLVFNREGSIVSVYRKPVSNLANCTTTSSELVSFTTDFGVTFGLLMDEDIVLHDVQHMKGLSNFVLSGDSSEGSFLSAYQFSPSWSYVTDATLISNTGIYTGKAGIKKTSEVLTVVDVQKNCGYEASSVPAINPSDFLTEDLSQYIIKPLNLEASTKGYKDTVCHGSFCCEFNVKTEVTGPQSDVSYGLAAYNGARPFTAGHHIGTQNCAVYACAGLYKRSCGLGPFNNTNIIFERISIAAIFTKNSQYPIVQTTSVLPTENFKFDSKPNGKFTQVTLDIVDGQNVLKLGVFGRDFSKDYESFVVKSNHSENTYDIYDYIFNEDVVEFCDYIWIRLRILIVVVSIYVLEMM